MNPTSTHILILLIVISLAGCRGGDWGVLEETDLGEPELHIMTLGGPGDRCDARDRCQDGLLCLQTPNAGFRCMHSCNAPYSVCPDSNVCLPLCSTAECGDNPPGVCWPGGGLPPLSYCESSFDCASGYLCAGRSSERLCQRACAGPSQCEEDQSCTSLGQAAVCRPSVGRACQSDGDCASSLACASPQDDPALWEFFPEGYCTVIGCVQDQDCPFESVCRTLPGIDQALCLQPCNDYWQCATEVGYDCLSDDYCFGRPDEAACYAIFDRQSICISYF